MSLADKQRLARVKEKGEPALRLEFDVFEDGSVSMWTHFRHGDNFGDVKNKLEIVREHLDSFMASERMCPFHVGDAATEDET